MKWLFLSFLFVSCARLSHYKTYQDESGIIKYKFKDLKTELASRDNDKKLILDKQKAEKQLLSFKNLAELEKSFLLVCDAGFRLRSSYHKANNLLKLSKPIEARELLKEISSNCKNIRFYSHIDYLYAYAYELEGKPKLRDMYLSNFLDYSQSVYPSNFDQVNNKSEEASLFKKYKEHARDVLAGNKFSIEQDTSKHLSLARYNSLDDTYLAGTKVTKPHFYLLPSFSLAFGGGIDGAYVFPSKYGAFIPGVLINEAFGTLGKLNYRKQLSQSLDRKHQSGINLGVFQWRRISLSGSTPAVSADVEDEGVGVRLGYGGTYQFTTKYNFMYQVAGSSDYEVRSNITALIGYNIDKASMFQYGLLNNHTVIAWKVMQIYIMYDFSAKGINANIATGFRF